jgi:chromosome segregation ATPase
MEEVIKYFEALEARIAALEQAQENNEAVIASLEAEIDELKSRPEPEPQVVEKVVEKIVEKVVEKPVPVAVPVPEKPTEPEFPEAPIEPEPVKEPEPVQEIVEEASPKAAIYGKAVDDIRLAISLGDRFLYQRELFGQNAELMQRTLNELNKLNSFDEALKYIARFNWDTESSTYQQFLVTLHRRFG